VASRFLTPSQVADRLQVPVSTLYAWSYKRTGPPVAKIGKHLRYDEVALEAWIASQRILPAAAG
jgi:predicted DNA-binding transcriptional regulator AlpA